MNEELIKLLQELRQLNEQDDVESKLAAFEKVSQSFERLSLFDNKKYDLALMNEVIQEYQTFISKLKEDKVMVSREIARLNQSNQALKQYIPLEELSGIELTY
ncbi:hypothetical protein CIRMBP1320_01372 [Enterococcus cecorum]|nr:hypothetical protein CIRMBP1320_01372 [Enterococcus cecorum]